jgi:hypothetical protein
MQTFIFLSALLIPFTSAQNSTVNSTIAGLVAQEPTCFQTCGAAAIIQVGCSFTDYTCQCSHAAQLDQIIGQCLAKNSTCSAADIASESIFILSTLRPISQVIANGIDKKSLGKSHSRFAPPWESTSPSPFPPTCLLAEVPRALLLPLERARRLRAPRQPRVLLRHRRALPPRLGQWLQWIPMCWSRAVICFLELGCSDYLYKAERCVLLIMGRDMKIEQVEMIVYDVC